MIKDIWERIFADNAKRLILVGGIPGSGKSFLSSLISSESGIPLFSMDSELLSMRLRTVAETNGLFFDRVEYRGLTREGWRAARENVLEDVKKSLSSGSSTIVDETFALHRRRARFVDAALSFGAVPVLVLLATPVDVAVRRDGERSRPVGERNIRRCAFTFDEVEESEGFEDPIVVRLEEGKYEEASLEIFYESLDQR